MEKLAENDDRIICLTAAMEEGCNLTGFKEIPGRFFDVGIAEEHLFTYAAGLAAGGLRRSSSYILPFAEGGRSTISRYNMQGLPVLVALDRSGLVGEMAKHHGYRYLLV